MLKWSVIIVVVLVATLLVIVLIGASLPQKHVASRSVKLHRPPEAVWELMTGAQDWRHEVLSVKELPPRGGHRTWQETSRNGQTITYEELEATAPSRRVTRIADRNLPFGGTWTYAITPTEEGCTLTITEHGEVYNPVFRFVSRF